MKRKFLGNIGFLLILNILIKGGWILGIDRVVQNTVGAEAYGNYYALLNFTFLFNILIDLGITNYNNRSIAQDRSLLAGYLRGLFRLKLLLALFYLIVVGGIALLLGYSKEQFFFIPLLAFNQILLSFILYFRSNLGGLHLFRADSVISVLDRSLMILFCGVLLWGIPGAEAFRIEWFVIAQTAAYTITALVGGLLVLFRAKGVKAEMGPSTLPSGILKKTLPYALLVLLMTFYNRVDSVMLERMLPQGEVQAGIYAQGFRILDAISQFAYLFATMLLPLFARAIAEKDLEGIRELIGSASRLLLPASITLAVISCFQALPLMELLYTEQHENSAPIFALLMISFVPVSLSYIFGTLLTAEGAMRKMNFLAGGGILINILLNFLLIPIYGALGSAIATLSTQGLASAGQSILAYRHFPFPIAGKTFLRGCVFLLLMIGSGFLLQWAALGLLPTLLLHAGVGVLGSSFTGILGIEEGKRLISGIWKDPKDRA